VPLLGEGWKERPFQKNITRSILKCFLLQPTPCKFEPTNINH
jgi:hypothetical protein